MPTTARLRLEPFAPSDAPQLYDLFRHPEVRRYMLDDALVDEGWVAREIEASRARFAEGRLGMFAVRPRSGGPSLVGIAGFRLYSGPDDLQLLYALDPETAGQGLAQEMVGAVVELALEVVGFERVVATVDVPNRGSIKLMERLGFTPFGRAQGPNHPMLLFERRATRSGRG